MLTMGEDELEYRKQLARNLLNLRREPLDDEKYVNTALLVPQQTVTAQLNIPFPEGLSPVPKPMSPAPKPEDNLPLADVVVVTWTVDEQDALADVLTPGFNRNSWYRYDHLFEEVFAPQIRNGSPASRSRRLGSYFMTKIGGKNVLCYKSELHLNQDGIRNYNNTGQTSLPLRDMFRQIIKETKCDYIFTVGTCGGIKLQHDLGDVLVTKAARFSCQEEFKNAPFNNRTYSNEWEIPVKHFAKAEQLMSSFSDNLKEPVFGPPTKRHEGANWQLERPFIPSIIHEKASTADNKLPPLHSILTTDFFEFGNSVNADELWALGCGVEMGDATLGLVCSEDLANPPRWAVIRNISDPQINGDITSAPRKLDMQVLWAVWYYDSYGYWTSVMSAITTWSVIAGLE